MSYFDERPYREDPAVTERENERWEVQCMAKAAYAAAHAWLRRIDRAMRRVRAIEARTPAENSDGRQRVRRAVENLEAQRAHVQKRIRSLIRRYQNGEE